MSQITLVPDKHDDNVRIRMVPEFFKPSIDVIVGLVLADIVDQERTDSTTVVCGGDCSVALLPSRIPDLSLDGFGIDLNRSSGKLHANCRLRVQVELVASESTQQIGFTDTGVSDEDHCNSGGISMTISQKAVVGEGRGVSATFEQELWQK